MKITVPHQAIHGETRVALTPAVVKRLVGQGVAVVVQRGAGIAAHALDSDYEQAGATLTTDATEIYSGGDVVATIAPPEVEQARRMKRGAVLLGMLAPLAHPELVKAAAEAGVTSFAMEFIPRISRAQPMDALSSQANIGGYKAALLAANAAPKMFPMMITAAGTIAPSKVFVLGAGVAGLQAIATAKRLGAVVEAFDVRAATKEQVQSLGGRFVELPAAPAQDDKATGGYAREQTAEERQRQAELMAKHVIAADAVIATAAVFGKAPPMLIPADVVRRMKSGSVIVDLAASAAHDRGNCELTQPGKTITTAEGVTIIGETNLPALVPVHASQVYANNVQAFLKEVLKKDDAGGPTLKLDLEDEIQKGAAITHDGQIVNAMMKTAAGG